MAKFDLNNALSNNNVINQQQSQVSQVPLVSGNGLPYNSIASQRIAKTKRNSVHWFVPQFGSIQMYINPESISYNYKKIITPTKVKGGFSLQYWGEELPTLNIRGTTGSSGIEGINVLHEIYRAEHYAFDAVGLSLANIEVQQSGEDILNNINLNSTLGDITGFALNTFTSNDNFNIDNTNVPYLANIAFGVEMYYSGWVFRGFFSNFTVNETTSFLFNYDLAFTCTERRGYRANTLPFQRSAKEGAKTDNTPYSFQSKITQ